MFDIFLVIFIVTVLLAVVFYMVNNNQSSIRSEVLYIGGLNSSPALKDTLVGYLDKLLARSPSNSYTRACVCIKRAPCSEERYQCIMRIIDNRKNFFLYSNDALNKRDAIKKMNKEVPKYPKRDQFSRIPGECAPCQSGDCPINFFERFSAIKKAR